MTEGIATASIYALEDSGGTETGWYVYRDDREGRTRLTNDKSKTDPTN